MLDVNKNSKEKQTGEREKKEEKNRRNNLID